MVRTSLLIATLSFISRMAQAGAGETRPGSASEADVTADNNR